MIYYMFMETLKIILAEHMGRASKMQPKEGSE